MSDDLPTLGNPSRPTSASSLSSSRTARSSPGQARLGPAGRAIGRGREVDVAAAALAALRDDEALAVGAKIGQQRAVGLVEDLRAGRDAQHEILAGAPVLVLVGARLAGGRGVFLLVAKVEQRGQAAVDDQHDAAAVAAVAARGAALGDELLAPERDRALAAVAGADADVSLIDELHGPNSLADLGGRAGAGS